MRKYLFWEPLLSQKPQETRICCFVNCIGVGGEKSISFFWFFFCFSIPTWIGLALVRWFLHPLVWTPSWMWPLRNHDSSRRRQASRSRTRNVAYWRRWLLKQILRYFNLFISNISFAYSFHGVKFCVNIVRHAEWTCLWYTLNYRLLIYDTNKRYTKQTYDFFPSRF